MAYVGRFAPSPTGRLHLGNLHTAALAWADSRAHGGTFLIRMEDLDTPRVVPGASDGILRDLDHLGIDWDGEVLVQSQHLNVYADTLRVLMQEGLVYPCRCSRADVLRSASAPHGQEGPIYPGICRDLTLPHSGLDTANNRLSWRVRVEGTQSLVDRRLGRWVEDLVVESGDFVVRRSDGIFAYQLACVVDDLRQGVTHVVRGEDLASSSGRQQFLWSLLGGRCPSWLHLPLQADAEGRKLSKRDRLSSGEKVHGPEVLGGVAHQLGWVPAGAQLKASEFLALYQQYDPWPEVIRG